jgi:Fe-S cluster biogenesis protein NfuA
MDQDSVIESVKEVQLLLRGDGADLVLVDADPKTARIAVRLDLSEVGCEDCVLPPDLLHEMITAAFQKRLSEEFEVVVDDPRVGAGN